MIHPLKWFWTLIVGDTPSELEAFVYQRYKKMPAKYIIREWNRLHPSNRIYDIKTVNDAMYQVRHKLKQSPQKVKKCLDKMGKKNGC